MIRDQRSAELFCKMAGAKCYETFDKNERLLVRFGMFPHAKTLACDNECAAHFELIEGEPVDKQDRVDIARWCAVGMMDAANAGKDKMVV